MNILKMENKMKNNINMRTKRNFIIEYELKKQLLFKSLPLIKRYLLDARKKLEQNSLKYTVFSDALKSIRDIYYYETIEYKDAFFLCMALGAFNMNINKDEAIKNDTITKIINQKLWDEDKVTPEMAVYFSCVFFNELYKDINIDMSKLYKASHIPSAYLILRKEIINEWEKNIQSQEKNAMIFEETNNPKKRRRRSNIKLTTYNDTEVGIE